jgi:hypothetical protein
MAVAATAIAAVTNSNQLEAVVEKTAVVAVVVALLSCDSDSCKDNNNGDEDGDDDGGDRSGGGGSNGDGGGDGCGSALGNLPSVNDTTIVSISFPTRPMTLMPQQWLRQDEI